MAHQFSQVPSVEIPRSSFDRSHGYKTTFNSGQLIPIFIDSALPGDTFNLNMTGFARLATPIFPIMDNMFMETFFFAVPYRLVWDNWQKFNGEETNPGDSTDFLVPQISPPAGGYDFPSLGDYMGFPIGVDNYTHSSLHFRAYNLIYNDWFRDQNIRASVTVDKDDGPDNPADYALLRRMKRHDYFTSCLPFPQKGEEVPLPLGGQAPITGLGATTKNYTNIPTPEIYETGGVTIPGGYDFSQGTWELDTIQVKGSGATDAFPEVFADLSEATATTINALREAFQIQRMFERDARGGTRYTEIIRSHFGVVSTDQRLQRPEYLGGGSSPVIISPVAQTSATDSSGQDQSPQANLAAIGTARLSGHGFTKSFTEHCLLIGLIMVRADLTYQQGLAREQSRETRFDFFWPSLANLGEQAVLSKEIFLDGTAGDEDVFGYQERFAEYRYKPSQITGKFRSGDPETLDAWHLSEEFATRPTLSQSFINENPPVDRVIAVPSEPHFLFDSYFQLRCARPMPLYGVPGLIDHF